MNRYLISLSLGIFILSCTATKNETTPSSEIISRVDFPYVKITDSFWSPRLTRHRSATLPVCIDQIENQTGRIRNFENAAKGAGEHLGNFYDDSDVYKVLEGMAYSLINHPDPELEKKCDEWIDKIAAAQQPDGYISTFHTLTGPDKRWSNMDKHEMYCAGHLTEAAIAYYRATGKRNLLDVSIRMADHMMSEFGPGKRHWVPGHPEIELTLVKLSQVTGQEKYLDFAYWLLEERGHGYGSTGTEGKWNKYYYLDSVPVRDLEEVTGHAVRAMYLFSGMGDVAALKGDEGYIQALNRLWDDVVLRKMYITGGIGSSRQNEGFIEPYDLPNYEAYCETCASVGMVFWNSRMHQLTGDSKYIDVLERSLYNGTLAGISLSGDRFFYVNPLASHGDHHRREWYSTACCPTQISRFLPSVGNYIYGVSDKAIWVNLFIGNSAEINTGRETVTIHQKTTYPWDGTVEISIDSLKKPLKKEIRLRIPGWCKGYTIAINGEEADHIPVDKGFAVIDRKWKNSDRLTLTMDMPVEVIEDDPRVSENIGKRAVQRGPLVYCMEEADNASFDKLFLTKETKFKESFDPSMLNGVVAINATTNSGSIRFIPYYAWDNREPGQMKVWVDYAN